MTDLRDSPLVRDLSRVENLPGGEAPVEFVSTHGSLVFLTGDAVFKLKRPKDYGFFDYSTLAARQRFCALEVELNRRTAPDVYLGVLPVFRDEHGYSLTRAGDVVDYAVHMRRLPDAASARSRLAAGTLGPAELEAIAGFVADFYHRVTAHPADPEPLQESFAENFAQVAPMVGTWVGREAWQGIESAQRAWLAQHAGALAQRERRDGHGDLRLEHVYLLPDGPILIDCIEFLDRFRIADPALDAAFLAMDLAFHGRRDLAELFLGSFAYASDDYDFFPLIDGYMSYRAVVRAKVAAFVAGDAQTPAAVVARKGAEARAFFALARELLADTRPQPQLIAVGGLIAAGKTTVGNRAAQRRGVPVVSADSTRKFLGGVPREERGPAELYTPEFTERVQAEVLRRAACVLRSGRSVIVDTTFRTRALRDAAHEVAAAHGARFSLIECRAPVEVLRVRLRQRSGGVSDAREDLLDRFIAEYEAPDELPAEERVAIDTTLPQAQIDALLDAFG